MNVARSIGAVLSGYLLFALSAVLLFHFAGRDPHAPGSRAFIVLTTIYGILFAALGGYVAAWIAGRLELLHVAVLSCVVALLALISLITELGKGSVWSQVAALLFMAPAVMLGGMVRLKKRDEAGDRAAPSNRKEAQ
jgi:hypothetical protein